MCAGNCRKSLQEAILNRRLELERDSTVSLAETAAACIWNACSPGQLVGAPWMPPPAQDMPFIETALWTLRTDSEARLKIRSESQRMARSVAIQWVGQCAAARLSFVDFHPLLAAFFHSHESAFGGQFGRSCEDSGADGWWTASLPIFLEDESCLLTQCASRWQGSIEQSKFSLPLAIPSVDSDVDIEAYGRGKQLLEALAPRWQARANFSSGFV